MTSTYLPLQEGDYYHIYNRANGSDNLFRGKEDYFHFLQLYQKYILPVADTFAWVLMRNHFHLLVRIKEDMVYKYSKEDFKNTNANAIEPNATKTFAGADGLAKAAGYGKEIIRWEDVKWETIPLNSSSSEGQDDIKGHNENKERRKSANPTHHFGHLCNAYAKYINEKYQRHGSLFQRPFRRKLVEDERYLKQLILYIHNNAVHHGFVSHTEDYTWSSYHRYLASELTYLCKSETISWFKDIQHFVAAHHQYAGYEDLNNWLEGD